MAETRSRPNSQAGWDPLQALRQLLDRAERSLNETLAERSAGERRNELRSLFSRVMLDAQRVNWRLWGRVFEAVNLPTRTDVIRMGKTLAQIEQRLTHLENAQRELSHREPDLNGVERPRPTPVHVASSDRPRPARTRRPPTPRASEEAR